MEKKLDNLTDKLMGALKTGTQNPEEEQEKSDLGRKVPCRMYLQFSIFLFQGKCAACGTSIEDSAVLAGGETFHQDCFTCTHCQVKHGLTCSSMVWYCVRCGLIWLQHGMGDAYSNKTASLATTVRYNSSGLVMVGKRLFPLKNFAVQLNTSLHHHV